MFSEDCKVLGLTWDKLVDTIIINFKDIRSRFVENLISGPCCNQSHRSMIHLVSFIP